MVKRNVLSREETIERASNIKLVIVDCDGVLTDTGVYYSAAGEEMKRFSIRDGMGVELLRNNGIETAILSGELSESIKRRAEKLALHYTFLGVKNKRRELTAILEQTGLRLDQLAYIGDDVNDLGIIEELDAFGITAAPTDGMDAVKNAVHYVCRAGGGHGAFRDFADWILQHRLEEQKPANELSNKTLIL